MKLRTFTFTPDVAGRADCRIAYEAFRARDPEKCVKEERQYLAQFQRAIEAITEPVGDLPEEAEFDLRFRKLVKAGGDIKITQRLHEKVVVWVEECRFQSGVSLMVEDFRDRWSLAEQSDRDEVPSQPHAVPKRGKS